jgi:hypothetical protein
MMGKKQKRDADADAGDTLLPPPKQPKHEEEKRPYSMEARIEAALLERAHDRHRTKTTMCPSEVPRLQLRLTNWRVHMDTTRAIARRLAREGRIEILQKGHVVDPDAPISGPIRLRLKDPTSE